MLSRRGRRGAHHAVAARRRLGGGRGLPVEPLRPGRRSRRSSRRAGRHCTPGTAASASCAFRRAGSRSWSSPTSSIPPGATPWASRIGVAGLLEPALALAALAPLAPPPDAALDRRLRSDYEDFLTGQADLERYAPALALPAWEGSPGLAGRLSRLGALAAFEVLRDAPLDGERDAALPRPTCKRHDLLASESRPARRADHPRRLVARLAARPIRTRRAARAGGGRSETASGCTECGKPG